MDDTPARRAVVWGISSAVGEAVARLAVVTYSAVLIVDRDEHALTSLSAELGTDGVVDDDGAAPQWISEHWGAADVLLDCTATMELGPEEGDSPERAAAVVAANILDPWQHTEALERHLCAGSASAVVYLGSVDGLLGNPHVPAYSAGKAAVASLTRTMAARLGPQGVRVNCVAGAGVLQTPRREGLPQRSVGDRHLALRLTPLGRFPTPEEIAQVAVFLASENASAVTGAVVPVDAGRTAVTPGTWISPP